MRTLMRLCLSVLLIIFILWIDVQLSRLNASWYQQEKERDVLPTLLDVRSIHPSSSTNPSPKPRKRPAITDLIPTPQNDRVIVVGKLEREDTNWVIEELPDWDHAIYVVDNLATPLTVSQNKGRESNVYLQYIIDHYYTLPSTIVFLHSHRDGYPEAWHTEFNDHSNVRSVRNLQTSFVQRHGYANLRCNPTPGCPDEIRPFREPKDASRLAEAAFPNVWRVLFNGTDVPDVIATPCCAQFAASRNQVHQRPLSSYVWYHRWLMETDLPDHVSGRVMEYMWHIIFGQDPVYCPEMEQCFYDVYGLSRE